jgi:RimJ/RimL family protein N-acetyltransferase
MAEARLEPWGPHDLPLLRALLGDAAMMEHLGGPETDEKIAERQQDYQRPGSRQYRIVDGDGRAAGWVGYWEREWQGEQVWEVGWSVLPAFQGRGLARAGAQQLVEIARGEERRLDLHAFPSVSNAPSNAICRAVGFELLGPVPFEYPKGTLMTCNDWRLALRVASQLSA